jgi:hypothetical protein
MVDLFIVSEFLVNNQLVAAYKESHSIVRSWCMFKLLFWKQLVQSINNVQHGHQPPQYIQGAQTMLSLHHSQKRSTKNALSGQK